MKDEDKLDLVLVHDTAIEVMGQSIEHLAEAVGTTNKKMEDIIKIMNGQYIITEKLANLDVNLKESFDRIHTKIQHIEEAQNTVGCTVLKVQGGKLESVVSDITKLAATVKDITDDAKKHLPAWATKWLMTLLVGQSIIFGTYMNSSINALEITQKTNQATYVIAKEGTDKSLSKVERLLNRNYGYIQGAQRINNGK